jgi:tetratricopeptide (TPR) repeat protein
MLSRLLESLGQAHSEMNRFADSDRCFTQALEIRRRTGDKAGEAMVLNSLGVSLSLRGEPGQGIDHMRSSLSILTSIDDPSLTATVLNNTAHVLHSLKRYGEALDLLERALAMQQDEDGFRRGITESSIAETCLGLGRYDEAARYCERSLASLDGIALGNRNRVVVLSTLGDALAELGRTAEAREAWLAALAILDRINDPEAARLRDRLATLA